MKAQITKGNILQTAVALPNGDVVYATHRGDNPQQSAVSVMVQGYIEDGAYVPSVPVFGADNLRALRAAIDFALNGEVE